MSEVTDWVESFLASCPRPVTEPTVDQGEPLERLLVAVGRKLETMRALSLATSAARERRLSSQQTAHHALREILADNAADQELQEAYEAFIALRSDALQASLVPIRRHPGARPRT